MNKLTNGAQAVLRAYNPATGATLWQDKYTATAQSLFAAVAVSPDSATVFATGRAQATNRSAANYLTVADNAAPGAPLWTARYRGPASGFGGPVEDVAVSPDGTKVVVTGDTGNDAATVAYNS